jgi:high-affinity iron transporter
MGLLLVLLLAGAPLADAATPQDDVRNANLTVQRALQAARAGDLSAAKQAYDEYETTWFAIEDGVRASSRDAYAAIEKQMTRVSAAFSTTPPDANQVVEALTALDREQQAFIGGAVPNSQLPPPEDRPSVPPRSHPGGLPYDRRV